MSKFHSISGGLSDHILLFLLFYSFGLWVEYCSLLTPFIVFVNRGNLQAAFRTWRTASFLERFANSLSPTTFRN